jgi:hypothetical protein
MSVRDNRVHNYPPRWNDGVNVIFITDEAYSHG